MKYAFIKLSCVLLLFCLTAGAAAGDESFINSGGLFLNVAGDIYFDPDNFSAGPMPGLRNGGGWEFPLGSSSIMLGAETGFFYIKNQESAPIPTTISLAAAYSYHFNKRFSLGLGANGGALFAPSENTNILVPFFGPRLSGEWTFLYRADNNRFISLYLNGGMDIGFSGTTLLFPLAELGLRVRFGKAASPSASGEHPVIDEIAQVQEEEPAADEVVEIVEADEVDENWDEIFSWLNQEPEESNPEWEPEEPVYTPAAGPTETVIEPEPVLIPNSRPENPLDPQKLPRGSRPLVQLPDGRRGFILEECTVYFGPDDSRIEPREDTKLRRAAQLLTQYPASRFVIAGYTAWSGTEQGRSIISWERARNVTDYMVRRGIKAGRAEVHWYGAAQPAVPNTSKANMARNRRIEFIVLE